jgi:hypothetical protein
LLSVGDGRELAVPALVEMEIAELVVVFPLVASEDLPEVVLIEEKLFVESDRPFHKTNDKYSLTDTALFQL